jgi:hypothetical protein
MPLSLEKDFKKKHRYKMRKKIDPNLLRSYMMGAANPSGGMKYGGTYQEIDLHLNESGFKEGKKDEKYALEYQLELFEKELDTAIAQGKWELRIIHGIGKGKLKQELHKILAANPNVKSFENSYHSKYGMGSTLVYFK